MATAKEALAWVDKLYKVLAARRPEIEKAFGYFEGDQPLAYASPQWKQFHADRYAGFSDNWCGVVGQVPVDRQEIIGFRLGGSTDVVTDDERQCWFGLSAEDGQPWMYCATVAVARTALAALARLHAYADARAGQGTT